MGAVKAMPAVRPRGPLSRRWSRLVRSWNETTTGEKIFYAFAYLVLSAWAVITLFPIFWMVTTALKPPTVVMSLPPEWIPSSVSLANFDEAFGTYPVLRWTLNSLVM